MERSTRLELAAVLTALSLSTSTASQALAPKPERPSNNPEQANLFGIKEYQSPARLGSDDGCGEGMCGTSDDQKKSGKAAKGKDGSCKGKDGSCKGKDGASKGKEGSCKGKDGSCSGHDKK